MNIIEKFEKEKNDFAKLNDKEIVELGKALGVDVKDIEDRTVAEEMIAEAYNAKKAASNPAPKTPKGAVWLQYIGKGTFTTGKERYSGMAKKQVDAKTANQLVNQFPKRFRILAS